MSDDRLTDLETRLAFLEDAQLKLSDLVYQQQQELTRVTAHMRRLLERIDSLSDGNDAGEEPPPPHY